MAGALVDQLTLNLVLMGASRLLVVVQGWGLGAAAAADAHPDSSVPAAAAWDGGPKRDHTSQDDPTSLPTQTAYQPPTVRRPETTPCTPTAVEQLPVPLADQVCTHRDLVLLR